MPRWPHLGERLDAARPENLRPRQQAIRALVQPLIATGADIFGEKGGTEILGAVSGFSPQL
jgi:hypothetical protein